MERADWPFLPEPPAGRIDLQRQLVESDPFFRLLGLRFHDGAQDRATLGLAFRDDLVQPTGILHGGRHGILIDSAIAQALLTTIRPAYSVVTVHLDTKCFAPVTGGEVFASASVVRKGKRIAHGEATVRDGRHIARAGLGRLRGDGWGARRRLKLLRLDIAGERHGSQKSPARGHASGWCAAPMHRTPLPASETSRSRYGTRPDPASAWCLASPAPGRRFEGDEP